MLQLIVDSLLLSLIHALLPNHWLPLLSLGKSERWSQREVLSVTLMTGAAHSMSTILLGALVGMLGYRLSVQYAAFTQTIAPAILVGMGVVYLVLDWKARPHEHTHDPLLAHSPTRMAVILSLCAAMFLSPCLEMQPYYLNAGVHGWRGILLVSAIYLLVTVSGMVLLVYFGYRSLGRLRFPWLSHHEKAVTGSVLVLVGCFSFYLNH